VTALPEGASSDNGLPPFKKAPRTLLKAFKLGLLRSAKETGLMAAVRDSAWRRARLLILAYHSLSLYDEHEFSPELYLPPSALQHRLQMLRRGDYSVLSLREGLQRMSNGTLPPRAVALTFDDGTYDFSTAVVPLLREYGFPATVYVSTHYAVKETPVFRIACRYLLWYGRNLTIDGKELTVAGTALKLDTVEARDTALRLIEERVRDRGVAAELAMLEILATRVGVDFNKFMAERRNRLMSPEEIRALPSDLVDVQLHTHRHKVPLNRVAFEREITENRAALQACRPGTKLDEFCYPSGVTNESFLPWLRELGITNATTCRPGLAASGSDPLMLPRFVDSWRTTELELEGWLTGVSQFFPSRSRYQPDPVYD
jgi:peptidoglycan/xylan/chitin deacetylase (PgdA/CDA1 family)